MSLPMRLGPPLLFAATAGGLALTARSLLGHALPLPAAVGAMAGYLGVVMLGVTVPRLGMWGDVACHVSGARGVALTFELGADMDRSLAIAHALEAQGARGTFFLIGEHVAPHAEICRELIARGHELGVLSYQKRSSLALQRLQTVRDELSRATERIEQVSGQRPVLFRPPAGAVTPRIVAVCEELDLEIVGWAGQVSSAQPETALRRARSSLRDGAIVRVDARCTTDAALSAILGALTARNLTGVTVSALLESAPG